MRKEKIKAETIVSGWQWLNSQRKKILVNNHHRYWPQSQASTASNSALIFTVIVIAKAVRQAECSAILTQRANKTMTYQISLIRLNNNLRSTIWPGPTSSAAAKFLLRAPRLKNDLSSLNKEVAVVVENKMGHRMTWKYWGSIDKVKAIS